MNKTETEAREILANNKNKEAAVLLGTSQSMVSYWRKKFKIRSPHSQADAARQFHLNHDFFNAIDTEEKAYILGFIAADGNVNPDKYGCEIRICLHQRDRDILEKINAAWQSTYPIRIHRSTEKSGFPGTNREQTKLSVRSSQMQVDLAKWNIIPAKTYTVHYPDLPDEMDRHFLRGFLEGDGYITSQEFGWVTNQYMANDLQKIGIKHGFDELRKYRIKEFSFCVKGGPKYHEMIKWIYKDATIFLDRKKAKFNEFWENRVYTPKLRSYPLTKHIPCALEALPPVLGSIP